MTLLTVAEEPPRLEALTGLRFLAAAHVLLFHVWILELPEFEAAPEWLERVLAAGPTSVSLFFVLSGFVLAYKYADPGRPVMSAREYVVARLARVYPVYLLALVVYTPVVVAAGETGLASGVTSALLALFALQAWVPGAAYVWNPPGWSISVEAFFYAVFPVLSRWLLSRSSSGLLGVLLACWGASTGVAVGYIWLDPDGLVRPDHLSRAFWFDAVRTFPVVRLPEFVVGVVLGVLFVRDRRAARQRPGTLMAAGAAVTVLAVYAIGPALHFVFLNNAALLPAFGLLVYGLAHGAPRHLSHRRLVRLGEASYALYILHAPLGLLVLLALYAAGRPIDLWACALFVLAALQASLLVHRWFEVPARRRLRLALGRAGEAAPPPPQVPRQRAGAPDADGRAAKGGSR